MTIKLYPVSIFFSASVERLVRKECYAEEQNFQNQNSSTYKRMLERGAIRGQGPKKEKQAWGNALERQHMFMGLQLPC